MFQWGVAGNTPQSQASKQARTRELVCTNIPPHFDGSVNVELSFVFTPTPHEIWRLRPELLSKEAAIERVWDFVSTPKIPAGRRLSFSYNDDLIDPGVPNLPRGAICPNCTSHNTAYSHCKIVMGKQTPMYSCLERVTNQRYPVNPCVACMVCQVSTDLMDRLWHRCSEMVANGEPVVFLAPNYRDRGAQTCPHCKRGPTMVTCNCT